MGKILFVLTPSLQNSLKRVPLYCLFTSSGLGVGPDGLRVVRIGHNIRLRVLIINLTNWLISLLYPQRFLLPTDRISPFNHKCLRPILFRTTSTHSILSEETSFASDNL